MIPNRENSAKNEKSSLGVPLNSKRNSPIGPISSFINMSSPQKPASLNAPKSALPMLDMKSLNAKMNSSIASVDSTLQSSLSDLYTPVRGSIKEAMSDSNSAISIPIVIGLGILTILLIIITIFREQVAFALNVAWNYIKSAFDVKPTDDGVEHKEHKEHHKHHEQDLNVDHGALQNIMPTKEVFNIAENKYKYSDADALCKAYGAELATYDQVKEAWNKGADWCNYGWIKGQTAVYPTQKETYDKLQTGPEEQRASCGIPGINGGYFDNPELRFGVNCYGERPSENDADDRYKAANKGASTQGVMEYDKKVRDFKVHRNEIPVNSFSAGTWAV